MPRITATAKINASKEQVWEVLADLGAIYKWNPGVSKSYLTSGLAQGDGAERHCDLGTKGDFLKERALDWREGEGFKTEVYDTNLPLKPNGVTFSLQSDGAGPGGHLGAIVENLFNIALHHHHHHGLW